MLLKWIEWLHNEQFFIKRKLVIIISLCLQLLWEINWKWHVRNIYNFLKRYYNKKKWFSQTLIVMFVKLALTHCSTYMRVVIEFCFKYATIWYSIFSLCFYIILNIFRKPTYPFYFDVVPANCLKFTRLIATDINHFALHLKNLIRYGFSESKKTKN